MKQPQLQILVAVANTQTGSLRTEVGKGSAATALARGLVVPKQKANAATMPGWLGVPKGKPGLFGTAKGKLVNIPAPASRLLRQRKRSMGWLRWLWEGLSLLFDGE